MPLLHVVKEHGATTLDKKTCPKLQFHVTGRDGRIVLCLGAWPSLLCSMMSQITICGYFWALSPVVTPFDLPGATILLTIYEIDC